MLWLLRSVAGLGIQFNVNIQQQQLLMYLYLAQGSWINSWRWRQCLLCKKKNKCFGICWSCWTWWITRFQTFQFNWKEACSPWKRNKRCLVKYGRTLTWSFKKGLRQQTTYLPGWVLYEKDTLYSLVAHRFQFTMQQCSRREVSGWPTTPKPKKWRKISHMKTLMKTPKLWESVTSYWYSYIHHLRLRHVLLDVVK